VLCSPSRCSLFTGWYPHVRGHRNLTHLLRADEPNFLRTLRKYGYDTVYIGKNDTFSPEAARQSVRLPKVRVPGSIDPVRNHPPRSPFPPTDPRHHSFLFDPIGPKPENALDHWKTRSAVDYLRSKPDRPFALFLALEAPHPPYSAPQPFHDLIDPASLPPLIPPTADKPRFHEKIREYRNLEGLDEGTLRKIQSVYLGQTAFADSLFGQVLDALDESGLADDTAVFFFSDHGDYAGDYGLVEKWQTGMEDCLTQVPLLVRVPGGTPGQVVEPPVELFDVMATTLDLAGAEADAPHFAVSQNPVLHGDATADPRRVAFTEGGYSANDWHGAETLSINGKRIDPSSIYYPKRKMGHEEPETLERTVMLRDNRFKLVYRPSGNGEFYDLASDPRETRNRWNDPVLAPEKDRLQARLTAWLVQTSDVIPFDPDPRDFPSPDRASVPRSP
jgi:choline-sulfatase